MYNYSVVYSICIINCNLKGSDTVFLEYLNSKYGKNTPILIENIEYERRSSSRLFKELNKLCSSGELARFDKGVYYIPTETVLGTSVLCAEDVIERKYITDGTSVYGYYGGIGFMNRIGLTTQVASRDTVYTNRESTRKRIVKVGYLDVIVKKARVDVTKDNATVLALLELVNDMPDWFCEDGEKRAAIAEYIKSNGISKEEIVTYISFFPDKVSKKFIESELVYCAS